MTLTPNVVAGAPITSTWGNEIRNRSIQVFASAAQRASQWTSPPEGAHSYLQDVDTIEVYHGTQWRKPWAQPWGVLAYVENTTGVASGINADGALSGLTSTLTYIANRRVKITGFLPNAGSTTSAVFFFLRIKETVTVVQTAMSATPAASQGLVMVAQVVVTPAAGSRTYGLFGETGTPGGYFGASATQPAFLLIEDIGPNGAPA